MYLNRLAATISLLISADMAAAASQRAVEAQVVDTHALTAARVADPHRLLLNGGLIDPVRERIDFSRIGAAKDVVQGRYALVQAAADDADTRARLVERGYTIVGYVPNRAYVVELKGRATFDALTADRKLRWAGYFQPGMKLATALYADRRTALQSAPHGGYDVVISGFAGVSADALTQALGKTPGVKVLNTSNHPTTPSIRVNVQGDAMSAFIRTATALDGVAYVENYIQPELSNSASIPAIQGNSTTSASGSGAVGSPKPLWDHNLFGSGQIVSISDSGLDANEAWFVALDKGAGAVTAVTPSESPVPPALGRTYPDNKVFAYWVQPGATANDNNVDCGNKGHSTSYHGTHVAGTVAGDAAGKFGPSYAPKTYLASTPLAANHELSDGMAPNAQILFQDRGNDTTGCLAGGAINDMVTQAANAGAFIHSASWGSSTRGVYSSMDVEADQGLRDNEDMLFVAAAGNNEKGLAAIVSPGNAKNVLTVAALGHAGSTTIADYSNQGPAADGRRKPDIAAPGSDIVSASGDSNTTATVEAPATKAMSGTSMATPTISGNAALVRQFFADGWYPRGVRTAADAYNPSGMAMKATLLNGTAIPSTAAWNSDTMGWGRAWLDSNLWFANTLSGGNDKRRLRLFERTNATGLTAGQRHEYTIANVAAGQELRVTLAWYDVPALAGAAIALVNNLDLEVSGPNGTLYLGNVFANGVSTLGGNADALNTVEQVRLTAPVAGSYTFRVRAAAVPGAPGDEVQPRQGYALAVSGAFGLPNPAALPAPANLAATTVGNTTQVAFAGAAAAQGFQLYRATGSCATAKAGDFRLVATGAASPMVDDTVQGGYQYAYKVRGVSGDVEGDASACVDMTSTAACTLRPKFDAGSFAITGNQGRACHVAMQWQAGATKCPTQPLGYRITRDTALAFTAPTILAANQAGVTYDDTSVEFAKPYFYRVEAVDGTGNLRGPSAILATSAIGENGMSGDNYFDNAEGSLYTLTEQPWHVTTASASAAGGQSYSAGKEGSTYAPNVCASIYTPTLQVQSGAVLNFKARYNLEHEWDGVVMEISTDGGATWADLPPDGGYPSSFAQTADNNACGFPKTRGAFSGVSTAASNADKNNATAVATFKPFTRSLAAYVGRTVKIRWRLSTDGGSEFEGVYLDDINLGGSAKAPLSPCEQAAGGGLIAEPAAAASRMDVSRLRSPSR